MTASIIDGKLVASEIRQVLQAKTQQRVAKGKRIPGLAVVLLGDDPASKIYVTNKRKACQEVGFLSYSYDLPTHTSQLELLNLIDRLNNDPTIDGILVQMPLPPHINADAIIERIKPDKDVDGFHPYNLGRLAQRRPLLRPCTAYGIMRLLEYYRIDAKGMNTTIVGASNNVGRPMTLELLTAGATVTTCHKFSRDLAPHIQQADLVVVATGVMDVIKPAWFNTSAIVFDVGIHRLADGRVRGDLDFESTAARVSWITPVPFGVGPMTIATLLDNTYFATEQLHDA